ncbi:MAG: hypothetical protein FJ213_06635 [Ignavibacteria bacterium]|nr:hypothetical protein [Ignavibacteria bacterium]
MNSKIKYFSLLIVSILVGLSTLSCEHGIEPRVEPPRTGFSGTIKFINDWPKDVYRTHIVVFKDTIKIPADFNILNIGFVSDTIPMNLKNYNYESDQNPAFAISPGVFKYICIAQSTVPHVSLDRKDWRVAGIYFTPYDSTKYGQIEIKEGIFLTNINITVDFKNPPIQPPK